MIDQLRTLAAVDRAFEEGVGRLFGVLQIGISSGTTRQALEAFTVGLEDLKTAHERATAIVEKSFGA